MNSVQNFFFVNTGSFPQEIHLFLTVCSQKYSFTRGGFALFLTKDGKLCKTPEKINGSKEVLVSWLNTYYNN